MFIFATTDPQKVPDTIRSRTQRYDYARVPFRRVADRLLEIRERELKDPQGVHFTLTEGAALLMAHKSEGSMRDAVSALDQVVSAGEADIDEALVRRVLGIADSEAFFDIGHAIVSRDPKESLRALHRAFDKGIDPRDLAEGIRFARGDVTIAGVLAVTIAMNLLGFPYSALVAPIGRQVFEVSPALVGVLAASESFGSFIGGLWLSSGEPRLSGRVLMVGGSLILTGCVFLMPLVPAFWMACGLLAIGGFGQSAFANMQTSLIVLHAPTHMRSRLMGLLTVCIGMGPLGILLLGFLADWLGPMRAIDCVETVCFVWVAIAGLRWRQRERVG